MQIQKLGVMAYEACWALQKKLVAQRINDEIPDQLLFVEHPPTLTVGRAASLHEIPADVQAQIPCFKIERGGKITYHGPGQLVAYSIIKLVQRDLHAYLRQLETMLIQTLADFDIQGIHDEDYTGVWVNTPHGKRKIASIGIAAKHWVTYHGIALNVNTDLSVFRLIQPCGLDPEVMCSMQSVLGKTLQIDDIIACFQLKTGAFSSMRGLLNPKEVET